MKNEKNIRLNGSVDIGLGNALVVDRWDIYPKDPFIPKNTKPQGPITPSSEPYDWDCLDPH